MARYRLSIGGHVVQDSAAPRTSPRISLSHLAYSLDGPAELGFTVLGDWRAQDWAADSVVKLERQETGATQWTKLFHGLLDLPQTTASPAGHVVNYTAHDLAAVRRGAVATNGIPVIAVGPGTVGVAVAQLLVHVADALEDVGLAREVVYSGNAENVYCLPLRLENQSITECMQQIAQAAPGVRCYVDASLTPPAWRFVNIYGTGRMAITIDETRIGEFTLRQSLEGRCGAVRCASRTATGQSTHPNQDQLVKAWDAALEATWSIDRAGSSSTGPDGNDALSDVFRLFSFASFTAPPVAGQSVQGFRAVPGFTELWQRQIIESVDFEAQTVLFRDPQIAPLKAHKAGGGRRSPVVPGLAVEADVYLGYTAASSGSASVPGTRYPASGFAGRAFALAPVSMAHEIAVEVPAGASEALYAAAAHRALSEPLIEGTVPIMGDPALAMLTLTARVCFKTDGFGLTGYEDLDAPITGGRINFSEGGHSCELQFSTDKSSLLRKGGA